MDSRRLRSTLSGFTPFALSLVLSTGTATAAVGIDQQPLLVAKPVPGNMAIIGSFEFPTMVSKANNGAPGQKIDTSYSSSDEYVGYFDSKKCYEYVYDQNEENRHFKPVNWSGSDCQGLYWSGHFLNWSTSQAIDVFRSVLTGGHRARDTDGETWLEKGWDTGQGSDENFPDSQINSNKDLIKKLTPLPFATLTASVKRLGNKLYFISGNVWGGDKVDYNPSEHKNYTVHNGDSSKGGWSGHAEKEYIATVRVKVCVKGLEELNCNEYGGNSKPEGLIQEYSDSMRFSHFSYLGDGEGAFNEFEGVGMRARMKYVGPKRLNEDNIWEANPNREWNDDGVFDQNPDPVDAQNSIGTVVSSGVINTINNAGMIVDDARYKKYDTVSELYYLAYRYLKKLSSPTNYGSIESSSNVGVLVDGLPVIRDWHPDRDGFSDPVQFSCQKNFALGIGDTNTHYDRTLPGGSGSGKGTPPSDDDVNVETELTRIVSLQNKENGGFALHGDLVNGHRSAYIAALAYNANTQDLRSDIDGKQTMSTYWIDIQEYGKLKGKSANQYWLAAKYGGLKVPEDYDPATRSAVLPLEWWYTNGGTLSPNESDTVSMQKPDNFYTVNKAADLVASLTQAFSDIQSERQGNRSSLALNSTVLKEGAATFQAEYTSGSWTGNLNAYIIDADTGEVNLTPAWSAASQLPSHDARSIRVGTGTEMMNFISTNTTLPATIKDALRNAAGVDANRTADLINYLRGDSSNENKGNGFRIRQGVLGDIVNSQPVYVGAPSTTLFRNRTFNGSEEYASWAAGKSDRDAVVYVGSNDGMLHGFDASVGEDASGKEVFAYIPHTVVQNGLGVLARNDYEHRYFVDGELTVADAYDGTNWRTVLIGTLGAGGVDQEGETNNAVFALDITDPANVQFMWEKDSTDIPALGVNSGRPVIAQVANGKWAVLLGNGPNSESGIANLISVGLFDGAPQSFAVSAATENGLSGVRAWDSDGDGFTDTVYAGDWQGNLWKIGAVGTDSPTATSLFTAASINPSGAIQPITAMPLVGRSPYNQQLWLFFGTGSYVNTGDLSDFTVQSWYGVKDTGISVDRDDLLERKILADVPVGNGLTARVIEEGAREDLNDKAGWFIDLIVGSDALGERMVTPNQFQGSALIGNTRIPDASDPCAPSGRGVIMAIDPFTGARLVDTYFDLNGDSLFTAGDLVTVGGEEVPASGVGLDTGFSNPSFLDEEMLIPTDDGKIRQIDINPFSTGAGRTSWRELINTGQ
ncbi:pilus assembly protein [Pseudomonas saliphila]|uniref:pilus assembly protein n=1 Tax=Pseudomonas saliphila TaxID=2586906 RepID=UPI001238D323|nr:PilC/PilY family type IV pilus protein [Pseudomonas saliphila]